MAVFRCKMCGAGINAKGNESVIECEYCNTRQTLSDTDNIMTEAFPESQSVRILLKRAFIFLRDRNWYKADEYCEKVLDKNPECAEAYLGKLMARFKVSERNQLGECTEDISKSKNYENAYLYGDKALKRELSEYAEQSKKASLYHKAKTLSESEDALVVLEARRIFISLSDYKDSTQLAQYCIGLVYKKGTGYLDSDTQADLEKAIKILSLISAYKDSALLSEKAKSRLKALKEEAERIKRKEKRKANIKEGVCTGIVCAVIMAFIIYWKLQGLG